MYNEPKGMAIGGMVLGIVGLVLCFIPIPFGGIIALICAIVGLIVSAMAMKRCPSSKGMAIAGLVCSIIALALYVLLFACAACVVGGTMGTLAALS